MKIAIIGFGVEGRAALEYWQIPENQVTICDQDENLQLPAGVASQLGSDYLDNLARFDLIVRGPGVKPSDIVSANSPDIAKKVTTLTNEFFRVCPTKNIIGVTGSKGKGTTSTLIADMLQASGKQVHLGGNIGIPTVDLLKRSITPDDWVVLELTSFQGIDLKYSPAIAVCLMVVPEHMNWHADMDEYITAKQQLFAHQTDQDIAIYFADNATSKQVASVGQGKKIPYYAPPGAIIEHEQVTIGGTTICSVNELKLLGKHNWQNVCAAITAVWQVTQDPKAVRQVLTTFTGLEHRLELVREVAGVKYYDDSFGTTPETAIVAIEAIKEPKIVILGGSDKGADYNELAKAVTTNNVRSVVAIGLTGPKIQAALASVGFTNIVSGGSSMAAIVQTSQAQAQSGDAVLLSTASASFDMFKNYKDRGEQFKQAVQALA